MTRDTEDALNRLGDFEAEPWPNKVVWLLVGVLAICVAVVV